MSKRDQLERLREFNSWVQKSDPKVAEELSDRASVEVTTSEIIEEGQIDDIDQLIVEESIALRRTRPVLALLDDKPLVAFADPDDSRIWAKRITDAIPKIERTAAAVGRIELEGSSLAWAGTGWLVHDEIMVTNRHVANEFAIKRGEGFSFRQGGSEKISASVDFAQEIDSARRRVFRLRRCLHIESPPGRTLRSSRSNWKAATASSQLPWISQYHLSRPKVWQSSGTLRTIVASRSRT